MVKMRLKMRYNERRARSYTISVVNAPKFSIIGPLVSRYSSAMCVYAHDQETVVNAQEGNISLHKQQ
jgi:hypothetical protein